MKGAAQETGCGTLRRMAWGPFVASLVALFVAWVTGRREHRARQRSEEADARLVMPNELSTTQIVVANRGSMHVTALHLLSVATLFPVAAGKVRGWTGEAMAQPGTRVPIVPVLPPGETATFRLQRKPSNGNPTDALPHPASITDVVPLVMFAYRDARSARWVRLNWGRPARSQREDTASWQKPWTWGRGWRNWRARRAERAVQHGALW